MIKSGGRIGWMFFTFVAAISWGVGNAMMKHTRLSISSIALTFWSLAAGAVCFTVLSMLFEREAWHWPNALQWLAIGYGGELADVEAIFLAFDILQLAVLLYLTGGLVNPFSLLLLAKAVLAIWFMALRGKLAFVHVHFGDKGSAARCHFGNHRS